MRKSFVYWLVGLAGFSAIAGCGVYRDTCDQCSGGCPTAGLMQRKPPLAQAKPSAQGYASAKNVRVGTPWWGEMFEPETRIEVVAVPEHTPPPSNQAERETQARNDLAAHLAEENAIIRRELAALRHERANKGVEAVQSETVKPVIESSSEPQPLPIPMPDTIGVAQEKPTTLPPINAEKEKTIELKSVDIRFGQTQNYKTITGRVEVFRKTLRLRYGAIDQVDTYGGVVVLEGAPELSELRDGQHIRVTGVIVPAESRTGTTHYRVEAIEVLD